MPVLVGLSLPFNLEFPNSSELVTRADDPSYFIDIPVLNINIYIMGRSSIPEHLAFAIGDNIEYLNQEFAGQVQFEFDELFLDNQHAFLPDLRKYYQEGDFSEVNKLLAPIEKKGGINVFVFDSYPEEGQTSSLCGFTPVMPLAQKKYNPMSPEFDRVFISYSGFMDHSTIVHEIGHFFGLSHPWELTHDQRLDQGIKDKHDEDCNHMSYGSKVHTFTDEQFELMRSNIRQYRKYLTSHYKRIRIKS